MFKRRYDRIVEMIFSQINVNKEQNKQIAEMQEAIKDLRERLEAVEESNKPPLYMGGK